MNLARRVINGDTRSIARLIRDVEDEVPQAREYLKALYPHTGNAHIVGVTGAPGTGKSTLVNGLVKEFRKQGMPVGVVAVDPTSPFTGGAMLGDRVRMQHHCKDSGVFIRSVATRGHLGGISRSTSGIIDILDAAGKGIVIVETVGVGQDEVEVVRMAHTTIVVLAPGMGDDIQAIKAGILEVGDIFVVNKADRDGADKTAGEIEKMLFDSTKSCDEWEAKVIKTQAHQEVGTTQLSEEIERHRLFLLKEGLFRQICEERARYQFLNELRHTVMAEIQKRIENSNDINKIVHALAHKRADPYSEAEKIMKDFMK